MPAAIAMQAAAVPETVAAIAPLHLLCGGWRVRRGGHRGTCWRRQGSCCRAGRQCNCDCGGECESMHLILLSGTVDGVPSPIGSAALSPDVHSRNGRAAARVPTAQLDEVHP